MRSEAGAEGQPKVLLKIAGDLSGFELDFLRSILGRSFSVVEEWEEEWPEELITSLSFHFYLPFSRGFFRLLGPERWSRLKEALKEVKRRRGNRAIGVAFHFYGDRELSFSHSSRSPAGLLASLEQLEYLPEIMSIEMERLPEGVDSVEFSFDVEEGLWRPSKARAGDKLYHYNRREGAWMEVKGGWSGIGRMDG